MTAVALLAVLQTAVLTVGPSGTHARLGDALAAARAGDTIRVATGVYAERNAIERPVVLLGEGGAVLDGGGEGVVLAVRAPATIRGFTIRASGTSQSREDAGILVEGARDVVIEGNHIEDVLFGIYVKQSDRPIIRGNTVVGKDLPAARRGDGIRLWYSHDGVLEDNEVRRIRDVVIWFSNGVVVRRNAVQDSRYGLHYMYSNNSLFEDNVFVGNHVGGFLMYSRGITFRRNVFAEARGTTGRGLGFKDAEEVVAEDNLLVRNAVGIFLDNSPYSVGAVNRFEGNTVAYNDVAVTMLPSVRDNRFRGNSFLANVRTVTVTGGGTALANEWRGNYWSEYAGFDADADGTGDTPFVHARLSDDLFTRHEALSLFTLSPAASALDVVGRIFPLLEPEPVVVDSAPRIDLALRRVADGPRRGPLVPALAFAALSLAAAVGAFRGRRPFRRTP